MFWFWFHVVLIPLMIVVDVIWWIMAMRLTKGSRWRILAILFMAGQTAALLALIAGSWWQVDLLRHASKAIRVWVILWHFFAIATVLPAGIVCLCAWAVRGFGRVMGVRRERPAAAPVEGNALTRRQFVGAAAALAPPLLTGGLTAVALSQLNGFRVRRMTISIPALPPALDGLTIAHVSDIHVGRMTCGQVLQDMVKTTNALRADLVLLTGDLINYELSDLDEGIALVKAMEARHALWMIEGNHDLLENGAEFERRVRASGVPFLLNETTVVNIRGCAVQFFGLRWVIGPSPRQLERVSASWLRTLVRQQSHPGAFPILLAHHPHVFDAAAEMGFPLTLAGHTHGGQLMFDSRHGGGPFFFRYWSGLYKKGQSQLVVSNGIGNWFPLRINAPAEIIHITLRSTKDGVAWNKPFTLKS
ncbi:MAG: metallophosphoesterase [Limisphaerales bacterium]